MRIIVVGIFWLIFLTFSAFAQVSPVPVSDQEVRDSTSTRMRSLEMERAKKNAAKPSIAQVPDETQKRFSRTRDDFEAIQTLQLSIVEAYMAGRTINYGRIREAAREMKRRARRLSVDFFNTDVEKRRDDDKQPKWEDGENLRDTLIDLDSSVGTFVTSPIFQRSVVDSKQMEKAELELLKIIVLSGRLSHLAESPK
jgi:hypothetical protein